MFLNFPTRNALSSVRILQFSCIALPEYLHVSRVRAITNGEPGADGAVAVGWGRRAMPELGSSMAKSSTTCEM